MPRLPADIIFRTMPPARSAMDTDAATNFSTTPGSPVFCEPAAAIVQNVRRSTVRQPQHTTAGNNGRRQPMWICTDATTVTAGARIDLYLQPRPPAMPKPRTIDRHNDQDRQLTILTYRTFYRHTPALLTVKFYHCVERSNRTIIYANNINYDLQC